MWKADFSRDAKGGEALSHDLFFSAAFELADIWTPDISAATYADFLQVMFNNIPSKPCLALRPAVLKVT